MAATDELGALGPLLEEYEQVEAQMADPQTLADPQLMRRVGRRYAELGRVKAAADRLAAASGDLEAARELAAEDRSHPIWRACTVATLRLTVGASPR